MILKKLMLISLSLFTPVGAIGSNGVNYQRTEVSQIESTNENNNSNDEKESEFKFIFPFDYSFFDAISSEFGERHFATNRFHAGIDLTSVSGIGTNVFSVSDGTVVEIFDGCANGEYRAVGGYVSRMKQGCGNGGNRVRVKTNYIFNDGVIVPVMFTYLHLDPGTLTVKEGDKVTVGETIGKLGNSGISTGAHLHFQISINADYIDSFEEEMGLKLDKDVLHEDIFEEEYVDVNPRLFLQFK